MPRPALALHDGPIMQFRRWCEQFYAEGVDDSTAPAVPELMGDAMLASTSA